MPLPLHSIPRSSQIFTDQLRLRPVDNRLSKSAVRAHYKSVEKSPSRPRIIHRRSCRIVSKRKITLGAGMIRVVLALLSYRRHAIPLSRSGSSKPVHKRSETLSSLPTHKRLWAGHVETIFHSWKKRESPRGCRYEARLLKTSISGKCSEEFCARMPYKRRSQFSGHFLSPFNSQGDFTQNRLLGDFEYAVKGNPP